MVTIDCDGRIVYGEDSVKERKRAEKRRRILASLLTSADSKLVRSQRDNSDIAINNNATINNAEMNCRSNNIRKVDEYGNVTLLDSDGNIREIIVSPLKFD